MAGNFVFLSVEPQSTLHCWDNCLLKLQFKSPSQGLCSTAEAASFMLAIMAGIQNPFKYTILPGQNR